MDIWLILHILCKSFQIQKIATPKMQFSEQCLLSFFPLPAKSFAVSERCEDFTNESPVHTDVVMTALKTWPTNVFQNRTFANVGPGGCDGGLHAEVPVVTPVRLSSAKSTCPSAVPSLPVQLGAPCAGRETIRSVTMVALVIRLQIQIQIHHICNRSPDLIRREN